MYCVHKPQVILYKIIAICIAILLCINSLVISSSASCDPITTGSASAYYDKSTNRIVLTTDADLYTAAGDSDNYYIYIGTTPASAYEITRYRGTVLASKHLTECHGVSDHYPHGTFYYTPSSPGTYYIVWQGDYDSQIPKVLTVTVTKADCATPSPSISKTSTTSATVSWSSITGAASYKVYYGTTSSCTSSATITSTSYSITGISAGSTVYAKVQAIGNSNYNDSSTSSVVSVQLQYTLSSPTLSLSSVTTTSMQASWGSISNASNYTVQYATNSSFSGSSSVTVSSTSTTLSGLHPNTTYYVRVRANSSTAGYNTSSYSSAKNATTLQDPLGTPSLSSLHTVNCNSIDVSFNGVENATSYIIEYSTDSSFSTKSTINI